MKIEEKYLTEDLKQTYFKITKKDIAEVKEAVNKLNIAFKKEDVIGIRSAARTIAYSANRIHDNMGNL